MHLFPELLIDDAVVATVEPIAPLQVISAMPLTVTQSKRGNNQSVPANATTTTVPTTGLPTPRLNPWSKIGKQIMLKPTTDPSEAMKLAGLDWTPESVSLRCSDTLEPVPGFKGIRRSDTKVVLGVVGSDYTVMENKRLFRFFSDLSLVCSSSKYIIETAGCLNGGRLVWTLARFPDLSITIGEDISHSFLLCSTGHVGNKGVTVAPINIRVSCANTLLMAERQASQNRRRYGLCSGFTLKHSANLQENLQDASAAFAMLIKNQQTTKEAYQHLAKVPLTSKLEQDFMASVFGVGAPDESERAKTIRTNRNERIAAILASSTSQITGTRNSAFSLINSVTEWIEHDRQTRTSEGGSSDEARLFSAAFGSGASLKSSAWDAMMELTA